MARPWRALLLLVVGNATSAKAQWESDSGAWMRSLGGSLGANIGSGFGVELRPDFIWARCIDVDANLYALGPEMALGGWSEERTFWGQAVGLRQVWLYRGLVGVTAFTGLENFTRGWSLDDTRFTLQAGPSFLGMLTLEYVHSIALADAPLLMDEDRFNIRLVVDIAVLGQLFARVPIS